MDAFLRERNQSLGTKFFVIQFNLMHITWHGLSCVKLQIQDTQLLFNPFQDQFGLAMPKLKVNIVASSNAEDPACNNIQRLQGDPLIITDPGEYEICGIFIYGIQIAKQHIMYIVEAEGITLALPGTTITALNTEQVAAVEGVDIVFLPITGSSEGSRAEFMSRLEPRIIIPIQYQIPKVKIVQDTLESFAKEMGIQDMTAEKKIIIKAKDLPVEETKTIILSVA